MKIIDKTIGANKDKLDYGAVLKCWDDDPDEFSLFKIARAKNTQNGSYSLDVLCDQTKNEDMVWNGSYTDVSALIDAVNDTYYHVILVKATITIEDL